MRTAGGLLLLLACTPKAIPLTTAVSTLPIPRSDGAIRAGFARVDITPPPGVGLAGDGPEGAQAMGRRLRLYARVLVLEDSGGNRLALVAADLPLGSAQLQRRVAESTAGPERIGIDRLIISVTHTHSGPGGYFDNEAYNLLASSVPGYDPAMLDSLSNRIALALRAAVIDLKNAKVAWGTEKIWGVTRIRSVPAMMRNIPFPVADDAAPTQLPLAYRLVDPQLTMLRVDQQVGETAEYRPAGVFVVFPMHTTGNSTGNDLLDSDIQGIVERRLERHIDDSAHYADRPFVPHSYSLIANGAEGDVSPAWAPQSRCNLPRLQPLQAMEGPFGPSLWQWAPPSDLHIAECNHAARQGVEWIADTIGKRAIELFDRLAPALRERTALARAFTTLQLRNNDTLLQICRIPAIGMAALVGADDAHTRVNAMDLFGFIPIGLAQGEPRAAPSKCQREKHQLLDVVLGTFPNHAFVTGQLPSFAELTVFRIGDRLLATVPAEVTTTAGKRMRSQILDSATAHGTGASQALILGLTDGYMEYVATAEEYTAQYYEGGSTLYGPGEAAMFGRELAKLTTRLSGNDVIPPSTLEMSVAPGKATSILKQPNDPNRQRVPVINSVRCAGDTLYALYQLGTTHDWARRDTRTAAQPHVEILNGQTVVSWDDDPAVELHLRTVYGDPAKWELRWATSRPGSYAVRVRDEVSGVTATSNLVVCHDRS